MAIKELFYDNRPRVLLDPRASQRIDPRFKYTRATGDSTYVNKEGYIATSALSQPRFEYDALTGDLLGLLLEPARTNLVLGSKDVSNGWTIVSGLVRSVTTEITPEGASNAIQLQAGAIASRAVQNITLEANSTYVQSAYIKASNALYATFDISLISGPRLAGGSFSFSGGQLTSWGFSSKEYPNKWPASGLYTVRLYPDYLNGSSSVYVYGAQVEKGNAITSYVPTTTATVTRAADLLSIEAPLPASGSVYIDARAIGASENDTLLSLKNSSNDKIDLGFLSNAATYNSVALIANYDGTSRSSLPLPVPTTDRERNIITYGSQNY
jgi:hypothetical protein